MLKDNSKDDTQKAVACYDLGEFARFYSKGKRYLELKDGKNAIMSVMQRQDSTPELKKEAITAYQRLLMNAYGMNQNATSAKNMK